MCMCVQELSMSIPVLCVCEMFVPITVLCVCARMYVCMYVWSFTVKEILHTRHHCTHRNTYINTYTHSHTYIHTYTPFININALSLRRQKQIHTGVARVGWIQSSIRRRTVTSRCVVWGWIAARSCRVVVRCIIRCVAGWIAGWVTGRIWPSNSHILVACWALAVEHGHVDHVGLGRVLALCVCYVFMYVMYMYAFVCVWRAGALCVLCVYVCNVYVCIRVCGGLGGVLALCVLCVYVCDVYVCIRVCGGLGGVLALCMLCLHVFYVRVCICACGWSNMVALIMSYWGSSLLCLCCVCVCYVYVCIRVCGKAVGASCSECMYNMYVLMCLDERPCFVRQKQLSPHTYMCM